MPTGRVADQEDLAAGIEAWAREDPAAFWKAYVIGRGPDESLRASAMD
jgi:hypothetical protein